MIAAFDWGPSISLVWKGCPCPCCDELRGWSIFRDVISSSFEGQDRGAILTTHYMEEADALCSRVAIMVNGQMEWVLLCVCVCVDVCVYAYFHCLPIPKTENEKWVCDKTLVQAFRPKKKKPKNPPPSDNTKSVQLFDFYVFDFSVKLHNVFLCRSV